MKRLMTGGLVAAAVFLLAGGIVVAQQGNTMNREQPGNEPGTTMNNERTMTHGSMAKNVRNQGNGRMMSCCTAGNENRRQHMGFIQKMRRTCYGIWQRMWGHDNVN